jgi:hypothetical protein
MYRAAIKIKIAAEGFKHVRQIKPYTTHLYLGLHNIVGLRFSNAFTNYDPIRFILQI